MVRSTAKDGFPRDDDVPTIVTDATVDREGH